MDLEKNLPLVSFILLAYNSEKYIESAVNAALAQDYSNLEVILSDDCSCDNTYDIMVELVNSYKGPHKVILNRNSTNLGIRAHCNKLLYDISNGEILLLAAGDDISLPNRTKVSVEFLIKHPEVSSLSCESIYIDSLGKILPKQPFNIFSPAKNSIYTLTDYVNFELYINSGDSRVLRKSVIEKFPPLMYSYSEDIFLFIRSLYIGSVAFIREPLVLYRQHSKSVMGKSRMRRRITNKDIKRFERTTVKQIYEDFEYAIKYKYIAEKDINFIKRKLDMVVVWLRPKRYSFLRRVCRFVLRKIVYFCEFLIQLI